MVSTKMPFGRAILEPALMSQLGHSRRFKREVGTTVSPNARFEILLPGMRPRLRPRRTPARVGHDDGALS